MRYEKPIRLNVYLLLMSLYTVRHQDRWEWDEPWEPELEKRINNHTDLFVLSDRAAAQCSCDQTFSTCLHHVISPVSFFCDFALQWFIYTWYHFLNNHILSPRLRFYSFSTKKLHLLHSQDAVWFINIP